MNNKQIDRIITESIHNFILKEIGDTYNPVRNNDNSNYQDELNNELSPKQKEYAFKRHCQNQAAIQGRRNQTNNFDQYAADQWNNDYGFKNPNGKDGEATDWRMVYGRRTPIVQFDDNQKPLNNAGHRAGLRKKLEQGYKAARYAPKTDNDSQELYYDGYGYNEYIK